MSNLLDYRPNIKYKKHKTTNDVDIDGRYNVESDVENSIYKRKMNKSKLNLNQRKISKSNKFTVMFMYFYNLSFLWSETIQSSTLISDTSHYKNTASSMAYNFLFINVLCYSLFKYSSITVNKKLLIGTNMFLYMIFSIFGGIGFALLGELSFFKHFAITKGFLKHLNPKAIVVCLFLTTVIVLITIKEIYDSIKIRRFKRELYGIFGFSILYSLVYFYLIYFKAKSIHYHVHHAIFSCVLSLLFINWESKLEIIMHAIFLGIVIEGIDFYGIGELYLFLSDIGPRINFLFIMPFSIVVSSVSFGVIFSYFYHNKLFY